MIKLPTAFPSASFTNFSKKIFSNKLTIFLVGIILVIVVGSFFAYQKIVTPMPPPPSQNIPEVDLPFDPEGPYALLYPARNGNALLLNLKRTASYDQIKYELVYNSQGVDRGATGDINTQDKKSEYEQEILFGTCSTGGKCVYDSGVENGTLTLHIRKGNGAYRMITQWHLQKPNISLGILTSGDGHFIFKLDPKKNDLSLLSFTIINDLSGAPKLPQNRQVLGKIYSLDASLAKTLPAGTISVELESSPSASSKIARFDDSKNQWSELNTKMSGNKLTTDSPSGGIFSVLTPKQ